MNFLFRVFLCFVTLSVSIKSFSSEWLITSVKILDIKTGQYSSPQNVLVKNKLIAEIGPEINAPDATVIDGTNRYLVPGFTEMHAHVPPSQITEQERDRLLFLYSAYGITTIRGMLGHPTHLPLREKLASNSIAGPRLITSGPSFNGRSVVSAKMAVGKTQATHQKGYDFIKIHPGMSDESFTAVAQEAKQLGLPFAGHVTADTGILRSAELGQATVDHLDGVMQELALRSGHKDVGDAGFFGTALVDHVDPAHIPKLAKELAKTGIAMVPTESLMYGFVSPQKAEQSAQAEVVKLMPAETVNRWIATRKDIHANPNYSAQKAKMFFALREKFIKAFVEAGGQVLLGSDAPQVFNVPGDAIHVEMTLMVQAGMTPLQVLQSASLLPARFFKQQNQFGSLETGKSADMVLLDADPLKDINNTRKIAGVMTRGEWLSAQEIKSGLDKIRRQ